MHPLFDRIMAGDICSAEINQYNAEKLLAWHYDKSWQHAKEDCTRGKGCVHSSGESTVKWAEFLLAEMAEICTCGTHK